MDAYQFAIALQRVASGLSEHVCHMTGEFNTNCPSNARLTPIYNERFVLTMHDEDWNNLKSIQIPKSEVMYIIENKFNFEQFVNWYLKKEHDDKVYATARRVLSAIETIKPLNLNQTAQNVAII